MQSVPTSAQKAIPKQFFTKNGSFYFLWKQIKTYFKLCFLWLMKTCKMWASFAKQRSAKRMQLGQIWSFGIAGRFHKQR